MFENLDQKKGQIPGAPVLPKQGMVPSMPSMNATKINPTPITAAPAKVEDMFAGTGNTGAEAAKKLSMAPAAKMPAMPKVITGAKPKSSSGSLGIILAVVFILIIIGLGLFLAARFLGIDIKDPSSWAAKLSSLKGPGQTVVVNNETPAPQQSSLVVEQPNSVPPLAVVPAASTTPAAPVPPPTVVAPVATSTPAAAAPAASSTVLADADKDGLPDAEEVYFGSNPLKADTDGDTYLDKNEVDNLYNPVGANAITFDMNIIEYDNSKENYSLLHPKSFKIQDVLNDGSVISFTAPDNPDYNVEISVRADAAKQDILAFYDQLFPNTPAQASDVIAKNGLSGLFSPDKTKYYAIDDAKSKIYTISYKTIADVFLVAAKSLKEITQ
jgi:hypothetical protein